ncbi:hypothetical protein OJ997_23945 [Solirubrobacter phytolaccae]|uniref:Uncharacterized protein n=1 Tax=Solirubrobacter phytolaccae TaxID=1404360 RepID=A0A9X3NDW3_9ACTN|nr:hypothetical protein [Solirubrobacter phytolaccae]MDA0183384.1 hypothetical protein [Solirubrobacter phytolaccae]
MAAVALVGCGGERSRACSPAIQGEAERRPPAALALPTGARVYLSEGPFGRTERFYAVIDGGEAELEAKRDVAAEALVRGGYTLLREDAEPPVEAEAHLEGADGRLVSVQVASLCDGKLRLRYTVS